MKRGGESGGWVLAPLLAAGAIVSLLGVVDLLADVVRVRLA